MKGSITGADAQGQFLSSIWAPFLRPDLAPSGRRAQSPSRSAVVMSVRHSPASPGRALMAASTAAGSRQVGSPDQPRFLKRQLSLPVSMMSQWWVSRSRSAVVILASKNTFGHSPKARLVVTMMDVRS